MVPTKCSKNIYSNHYCRDKGIMDMIVSQEISNFQLQWRGGMAAWNSSMFPILCSIMPQILTQNYSAPHPDFLADPLPSLSHFTPTVPQMCQAFSYLRALTVAVLSAQMLFSWKSALITPLPPSGLCSEVICPVKSPTTLLKIKSHTPHPPPILPHSLCALLCSMGFTSPIVHTISFVPSRRR